MSEPRYVPHPACAWTDQSVRLGGASEPLTVAGQEAVALLAMPDGPPCVLSGSGLVLWRMLTQAGARGLSADEAARHFAEPDATADPQVVHEIRAVFDDWVARRFIYEADPSS
ncbi:MAG: hypothetical protein Q4P36_00035 [Bowdeniella nasicola]|nr:hypothetical protein [Bowdeniella nasicola]